MAVGDVIQIFKATSSRFHTCVHSAQNDPHLRISFSLCSDLEVLTAESKTLNPGGWSIKSIHACSSQTAPVELLLAEYLISPRYLYEKVTQCKLRFPLRSHSGTCVVRGACLEVGLGCELQQDFTCSDCEQTHQLSDISKHFTSESTLVLGPLQFALAGSSTRSSSQALLKWSSESHSFDIAVPNYYRQYYPFKVYINVRGKMVALIQTE